MSTIDPTRALRVRRVIRLEPHLLHWGTLVLWAAMSGVGLAYQPIAWERVIVVLLPWIAAQAAVSLLPIMGWRSTALTAGDAIAAAISVVFSPIEAGLVLFTGSPDVREFRREISIAKALFNRSQLALSAVGASAILRIVIEAPPSSKRLIPAALLALAVNVALNYLFVAAAVALEHRCSAVEVVRRLRVGDRWDFALIHASWAVLAAMTIALYTQVGNWALVAFLAPSLLSRQTLLRSKLWREGEEAKKLTQLALRRMADRISDERRDERRIIAADLHDDVLGPIYNVSLMGHVLKADLSSGRLLDLEKDVPSLLEAATTASNTLRALIGDLRQSPLGRDGISSALSRLARELRAQTGASIKDEISEVSTSPEKQLILYQVAKEALTNAVLHGKASSISLELHLGQGLIRLLVEDDGTGFDPFVVRDGHYGILIMRERAASVGASLFVDSALGSGTRLMMTMEP